MPAKNRIGLHDRRYLGERTPTKPLPNFGKSDPFAARPAPRRRANVCRQQIDGLRQRIGVCPQFDRLWDELTGREHLKLFASIKGVPVDAVDEEASRRLGVRRAGPGGRPVDAQPTRRRRRRRSA